MVLMAVLALIAVYYAFLAENYKKEYELINEETIDENETEVKIEGQQNETETYDRQLLSVKQVCEEFIDIYYGYSDDPYERYLKTEEFMTENALENLYQLDDSETLDDLEQRLKRLSEEDENTDGTSINSEIIDQRCVAEMIDDGQAVVVIHGKLNLFNDDIGLDNYTDYIFDAELTNQDGKWLIDRIYTLGS